jgi:hypothetical protein
MFLISKNDRTYFFEKTKFSEYHNIIMIILVLLQCNYNKRKFYAFKMNKKTEVSNGFKNQRNY